MVDSSPSHLAFLIRSGSFQHLLELAAALAAADQVNHHGGNSLRAASDLPMGAPSRTRSAASSTALRIGMLLTTSAEIRRASSTGTALASEC